MAKSLFSFTALLALLFCFLLLVPNGIKIVVGKECEKAIRKYFGPCTKSQCNSHCVNVDNAKRGYCKKQGQHHLYCYCIYDCEGPECNICKR